MHDAWSNFSPVRFFSFFDHSTKFRYTRQGSKIVCPPLLLVSGFLLFYFSFHGEWYNVAPGHRGHGRRHMCSSPPLLQRSALIRRPVWRFIVIKWVIVWDIIQDYGALYPKLEGMDAVSEAGRSRFYPIELFNLLYKTSSVEISFFLLFCQC